MYHQKIIMNTFKYFQFSYRVMNNFLFNLRKNRCATHLSQIQNVKNYHSTYKSKNLSQTFIASNLFWYYLFGEKKDDVEELKMTIKRSILLMQKEEYLKAEQMLHIALRQAQTLQHYDGITYVYDVMANVAYKTEDFKKAENLYTSVLKRLIAKGIPQNDLQVIQISAKLAHIYGILGDKKTAETGFQFCKEHLEDHLAKDSGNLDALKILGTTLDMYANFCYGQSQYTNALKYYLQAYNICIETDDEDLEKITILLNSVGTTYYMLQKYDEAIEYYTKAIELEKKIPDAENAGASYINLGNALIKKQLYDEAKNNCIIGERMAKQVENKEWTTRSKDCLDSIRSLMSEIK